MTLKKYAIARGPYYTIFTNPTRDQLKKYAGSFIGYSSRDDLRRAFGDYLPYLTELSNEEFDEWYTATYLSERSDRH
jgi:hypothetical protein